MKQLFALILVTVLVSCHSHHAEESSVVNGELRYLTVIGTNDIHGGVEPSRDKTGRTVGGLAMLGSVVRAHREGLQQRYGNQGGVVVVDAGDQFQGTLISNYDEGELVFAAMNAVGYDGVVPGNHDFDFGPLGWLVDQSADTSKRRESLEKLVRQAKFPLLSGNTFFKDSIVDTKGNPLKVGALPAARPSEKRSTGRRP